MKKHDVGLNRTFEMLSIYCKHYLDTFVSTVIANSKIIEVAFL